MRKVSTLSNRPKTAHMLDLSQIATAKTLSPDSKLTQSNADYILLSALSHNEAWE
jgi:hypothetical protein